MIYLDYAAASPALPEMFSSQTLFYGGERETEQARAQIAQLLSGGDPAGACAVRSGNSTEKTDCIYTPVSPEEILFTSGGTESDNLAILGTFFRAKREYRPFRLLTGATEHEAVLQAVMAAEEYGEIFHVDVKTQVLPAAPEGAVDPETVREALREIRKESGPDCDPLILVSLIYGNNETGVLTDVEGIGRICRDADALFHTDAVQAVGHVRIDLSKLPVDMLSASAHKFGGPKGAGFLYVRKSRMPEPMFYGDDASGSDSGYAWKRLRPGMPCTYGVIGMAQAFQYRMIHLHEEEREIRRLRNLLQEGILRGISGVYVNGGGVGTSVRTENCSGQNPSRGNTEDRRLPGHLNVSFDGIESTSLLFLLDMKGICASGGSACAAQSHTPSHVLAAMGFSEARINSAVRFSLGPETTEGEILETLRILKETVSELRLLRGVSIL